MPALLRSKDIWAEVHFDEIVELLWFNRKAILADDNGFDSPNYGGLPARLSDKLSTDFVDAIQEAFDSMRLGSMTMAQFVRLCAKHLYAEWKK